MLSIKYMFLPECDEYQLANDVDSRGFGWLFANVPVFLLQSRRPIYFNFEHASQTGFVHSWHRDWDRPTIRGWAKQQMLGADVVGGADPEN